jgi:hypothetical protein
MSVQRLAFLEYSVAARKAYAAPKLGDFSHGALWALRFLCASSQKTQPLPCE